MVCQIPLASEFSEGFNYCMTSAEHGALASVILDLTASRYIQSGECIDPGRSIRRQPENDPHRVPTPGEMPDPIKTRNGLDGIVPKTRFRVSLGQQTKSAWAMGGFFQYVWRQTLDLILGTGAVSHDTPDSTKTSVSPRSFASKETRMV